MSPKKKPESVTIPHSTVIEGQLAVDRALRFDIWQFNYFTAVLLVCIIIVVVFVGFNSIAGFVTWFYSKWELP